MRRPTAIVEADGSGGPTSAGATFAYVLIAPYLSVQCCYVCQVMGELLLELEAHVGSVAQGV